jgi:hypothetical protein
MRNKEIRERARERAREREVSPSWGSACKGKKKRNERRQTCDAQNATFFVIVCIHVSVFVYLCVQVRASERASVRAHR